MKIINRKDFLKVASGTVYSLYETHFFNGLYVKGDTMREDFGCYEISSPFIDAGDNDSLSPKIIAMAETGESLPVDFTMFGRDGCFEENQLFAVWERNDVLGLIDLLEKSIEETDDQYSPDETIDISKLVNIQSNLTPVEGPITNGAFQPPSADAPISKR